MLRMLNTPLPFPHSSAFPSPLCLSLTPLPFPPTYFTLFLKSSTLIVIILPTCVPAR